MTAYAKVASGKIVTLFTCPQDPEVWPDVVELSDTDPVLLAYISDKNLQGVLDVAHVE